jgi:hypothetical protein
VIIFLFVNFETSSQTNIQTKISTSTLLTETYGMSKYTDSTYGFSFWYPSALQVTSTATNDDTDFPGGVAVENLQIGSMGGTEIFVVNSPMSTITDEPVDHASPIGQTEYFYNNASKQWMMALPQGAIDGIIPTTTADVSKTTMSGLVMLPSGRRFDTTIIPLSTTRFLVVSDGGGSSFTNQLTQTISQIGASIDTSKQESALQAESDAYAIDNGCKTDTDCQNGASCMTEGPIIANRPVHKVCVPKGQAVPL